MREVDPASLLYRPGGRGDDSPEHSPEDPASAEVSPALDLDDINEAIRGNQAAEIRAGLDELKKEKAGLEHSLAHNTKRYEEKIQAFLSAEEDYRLREKRLKQEIIELGSSLDRSEEHRTKLRRRSERDERIKLIIRELGVPVSGAAGLAILGFGPIGFLALPAVAGAALGSYFFYRRRIRRDAEARSELVSQERENSRRKTELEMEIGRLRSRSDENRGEAEFLKRFLDETRERISEIDAEIERAEQA